MDFLGGSLGANTYDDPRGMVNVEKGPQPIRVQIQREKDMHAQEVKRLDAMLKLIEDNPAIEQFINLQRGYVGQ